MIVHSELDNVYLLYKENNDNNIINKIRRAGLSEVQLLEEIDKHF